MFVKLCASRLHREERGSALAAVIGIFAVTVILAMVAGSATINAIGFTSATRAGVQSNAAAEAGINFVVSQLQKGTCKATFTDADAATELGVVSIDVEFTVTVTSRTDLTSDWPVGCPTAASTQVRLLSSGTASMSGLGGQTRGDSQQIEAVYEAVQASTGIEPSGAAVYAYSSTGFSGSGSLVSVGGSRPSVQIKTGTFTCSGNIPIGGDVILAAGSFLTRGTCKVDGSIWASGNVSLSGESTYVNGDVVGTDVTISDAHLKSSVWASNNLTLSWGNVVDGNATAVHLKLVGGNVKGTAWSSDSANFQAWTVIDGRFVAKSVAESNWTAKGGSSIGPPSPGPGPAVPPAPTVPSWVDFSYQLADWVGFGEKTLTGSCTFATLQAAATDLAGAPGVIDARNCTGGVTIDGSPTNKLVVANDLAIIANTFSFGGSGGFTATADRRLWLIAPDTIEDGAPSCSGGGFTVGGGFTLDTRISAMVYSPCLVSVGSGIVWAGQIFSGKTTINGSATLRYQPIGLPGVNLTTGIADDDASAGAGVSLIAARISIRDTGADD